MLNAFLTALKDNDLATVTPEMAETLMHEYPFFTLPASLVLQRTDITLDEEERRHLMARVALNASDPATMMALVDPDARHLANFYPVEHPVETTTDDAIDTFLETYGKPTEGETALLERLIFNPTPEYRLEDESEQRTANSEQRAEPDDQMAAIDAFLAERGTPMERGGVPAPRTPATPMERGGAPTPRTPTLPADPADIVVPAPAKGAAMPASTLSESLARIYIRQHKYQKAYDILSAIAESDPDASPFIPDQLRFLRRLLALTK